MRRRPIGLNLVCYRIQDPMEFMDEFAFKVWSVLKDELFTKFVKTKAAANIASYDTQFRQIR